MQGRASGEDKDPSWENLSAAIERSEALILSEIDSLMMFLAIQGDCLRSWLCLARSEAGKNSQLLRQKLLGAWRDKILGLRERPDLLEAFYAAVFSEQVSLSFLPNLEMTLSQAPLDKVVQEDFFASMTCLLEGLQEKSPLLAIKLLRYLLRLASHYKATVWPRYWLLLSDSLLRLEEKDEGYYPLILNHAVEALAVARLLEASSEFYETYRDKRLMDCLARMIYQRFLGPEGDWPRYWVEQLVAGAVEECLAWLQRLKWVGEVLEAGGALNQAKEVYRWLLRVANEDLPQLVNYRENASASYEQAKLADLKENLGILKATFHETFKEIIGNLLMPAEERIYPSGDSRVIEGWDKRSRLVSWRSALRTALRENTWQSESDTLPNQRYRLLKSCFEDAEKFLGKAPCEYAVILLGSSARSEACAYSDVEWLVVLPVGVTATGIIASYFSGLMQAVGLQLILLEETPQPDGSRFVPCAGGLLVNGLCADKYTPLRMASTLLRPIASHEAILLNSSIAAPGDKGSFLALLQPKIISPVHSVDEALSQLAGQWYPDVIVPLLILDAFYLQGNERLAKAYLSMVTKLLNERVVGEVRLGQLFGLYLLQGLDRMIEGFQGVMRAGEFDTKAWCQVLTTLLKSLALYRGLPLNRVSSQSRLEGLYAEGYISRAVYLAWETSLRMSLRWRNQLHLARQREEDKLVLTVTESSEEIQALQKEIQGIWPILWAECFQPGIQAIQTLVGKAIAERPIPDNLFHAPTLFPRVQLYVASGEPTISHPWSFPPLLNYVYTCPNPRGERWCYTQARQRWEEQWQALCVVSGSAEKAAEENATQEKARAAFEAKVSWLSESGRVELGQLKPEVVAQLLDEEGEFDGRKRINLEGRRIALPIRDKQSVIVAYAKAYPELPLVQLAVEDLSWRLSGYGHLSSLVKFRVQRGGKEKTYPVLLSRYMGPSLQTRLRESGSVELEAIVNRLDSDYFTLKGLETYVVSPGDDKLDNLVEEVYLLRNGEKRGRWVSIDADHPFESVVLGSGEQEKVGLRSVVYCLVERMEEGISKRIQVEWGQMEIESLLRSWLEGMKQVSEGMLGSEGSTGEKLFESAELIRWAVDKESLFSTWGKGAENKHFSYVSFMLEPGVVGGLYQRLRRLQVCLRDPEILMLRAVLEYLLPRLMVHYVKAQTLHPKRLDNCFHALPTDYAVVVEETAHGSMQRGQTTRSGRQQVMRTLSVVPGQVVKRSLTRVPQHQGLRQAIVAGTLLGVDTALKEELPEIHAFYQQLDRQLLSLQGGSLSVLDKLIQPRVQSFMLEELLSRLTWLGLGEGSNAEQSQRFGVQICQRLVGVNLQRLLLRDCAVLSDELLLKLVAGMPELVEVDISGCSTLTNQSWQSLQRYTGGRLVKLRAERNHYRQCLPHEETGRDYRLQRVSRQYTFQGLHYLSVAYCKSLRTLRLPQAHTLRTLVVSGCGKLKTLAVEARALTLVAGSCSQLNKALLEHWWVSSNGIERLCLPDNEPLGLTDAERKAWEDYPGLCVGFRAEVLLGKIGQNRRSARRLDEAVMVGHHIFPLPIVLKRCLCEPAYEALKESLEKLLSLLVRAEEVLVEELENKDGQVFLEAINSLKELGVRISSAVVVSKLLAMLKDRSWEVRRAGAASLGALQLRSDAVVSGLLGALKDKDSKSTRMAAVESLAKLQVSSDAVVSGLLLALKDRSWEVRCTAAASLGALQVRSDAAVFGLLGALKDKNSIVRLGAANSLVTLQVRSDVVILQLVLVLKDKKVDAVRRVVAAKSLGALGVCSDVVALGLVVALKDEDNTVRLAASKSLEELRVCSDTMALELVVALKNENWSVRAGAAESLGALQVRSDAVVSGLVAALKDMDWRVRLAAAESLGTLGVTSGAVVLELVVALKDKDNTVRLAALKSLEEIRVSSDAVVSGLLLVLKDKDSDDIRVAAAKNLGALQVRSDAVMSGLLLALEDKDIGVRWAAAKSLGALQVRSDAVVSGLLRALKDKDTIVRLAAANSLVALQVRSNVVVLELALALKDTNRDVCMTAAKSLVELKLLPDAVVSVLLLALKDKDATVRFAAARSLGGATVDSNVVVLGLVTALKDEYSNVRRAAAESLGALQVRSDAVVSALVAGLKDMDWQVRLATAESLGALQVHSDAVVSALLEALKAWDSRVRIAAAKSLKALGVSSDTVVSGLGLALKDTNRDVRITAAKSLEPFAKDSDVALVALLPLLKDENSKVRKTIITILKNLFNNNSLALPPHLLEALLSVFQSILLGNAMQTEKGIQRDAAILLINLHDRLLEKIIHDRFKQVPITHHLISQPAITSLKTLCFRFFWQRGHQHLPAFPGSIPSETREGLTRLQPEYQEYCQIQAKHH